MLETADRLVAEEKQPSLQQFLLLVGGLRAMTAGERPPGQVLDSYLLRSLAVAGYAPSFEHCARCGERPAPRWFNPPTGGVLCADLPGPRLGPPVRRDVARARRAAGRRLAGRALRRASRTRGQPART